MKFLTQTRFELRGEFAGFVRTAKGKRRLLLRVAGDELRLKMPKVLRRELESKVGVGSEIEVAGYETRDRLTQRIKREVVRMQIIQAKPFVSAPCRSCKIRVCTKANCWEQGGKELWRELERKLDEARLTDAVELKGVHCLDRCKHAPNLAYHGEHHERCQHGLADTLIAQIAVEMRPADPASSTTLSALPPSRTPRLPPA